jgi:FG-GAP-like repeat
MSYQMSRFLILPIVFFGFWISGLAADAAWQRHLIDNSSHGADGVRLADVNEDGRPDIATGWEQGGVVRVYLNPGGTKAKEPWPAVTVGRVPSVEDAVFADVDADGTLDVVSSAVAKTRAISVHWAPREKHRYLDPNAWRTEQLPAAANKMQWMFTLPLQLDGKNGTDLFAGGKKRGAAIGWFEAPPDARRLADWKWHEIRSVGWLMSIAASDMDGDSDQDIVFSDRKGPRPGCFWLENPGMNRVRTDPWREHAIGAIGTEAMFLRLVDLDRDGFEDVLVTVKPREILWLRRLDGTGRLWKSHSIPLPEIAGTAKAVNAGDINGDGKLDLVFSCEEAEAPRHGLMWLSPEGEPAGGLWTSQVLSGTDGVKYDLVELVDLDQDGDVDVLTTEEGKNLGLIWYENPGRGGGP